MCNIAFLCGTRAEDRRKHVVLVLCVATMISMSIALCLFFIPSSPVYKDVLPCALMWIGGVVILVCLMLGVLILLQSCHAVAARTAVTMFTLG